MEDARPIPTVAASSWPPERSSTGTGSGWGAKGHPGDPQPGQADTAGFDAFSDGPQGPSLEAELVGVVDGPVDLSDPNPVLAFPPSLLDGGNVGISATQMVVRLAEGTGLARFRTALDQLPDRSSLSLEPAQLIPADVRTAVEAQTRGIWVQALFTAIAAVVVLGQLVTRSVRLPEEERRRRPGAAPGPRCWASRRGGRPCPSWPAHCSELRWPRPRRRPSPAGSCAAWTPTRG